MRRGIGVAVVAALLAACTLFTPLGTDLTGGGPLPDATAPADATAEGGDASPPSGDAGADVAVDAAPTCTSGALAVPVRAFDATPPALAGEATACNVDKALVEDKTPAGLDRNGSMVATIDGHDVTSCLGVELPGPVDEVVVTSYAVGEACNYACFNNDAGCGTGDNYVVFVGPSATALAFLAEVFITQEPSRQTFPVAATDARFVVACRLSWGQERDDIAIDFLTGRCR